MKLADLRKIAERRNVKIATVRDEQGWGYWLTDMQGNDLWKDGNYFTTAREAGAEVRKLREAPKYFVDTCKSMKLDDRDFERYLSDTGNPDHYYAPHWATECRKIWYQS